MKNKFMKRTVSLVLSIVMIFSMMTVGVVNTYAAEDGIGDIIPGMGIINAVGGRLFNEFTSYCIGNEVTFLGDFFYITLCDPATRARIEANQTIQEINKTVNEIKKEVETSLAELDKINDKLDVVSAKQDYINAVTALQKIEGKYSRTLQNYNDATMYTYESVYLTKEMDKMAEEGTLTDIQKAQYEKRIAELDKNAEKSLNSFVLNYQEDIKGLNSSVISAEAPVYYNKSVDFDGEMKSVHQAILTYLSACEAVLRASNEFEHEITESMLNAFEYCEKVETEMFLIHKAYASVCEANKFKNTHNEETVLPSEEELLDFSQEEAVLANNLIKQVTESDLDNLMVTQALVDKMQKEYTESTGDIKSVTGGEYNPPMVDTKTKINGKEVPCYMVRDNKSLDYFLITQQAETFSSTIKSWKNGIGTQVYRPTAVLDQKYTDDGNYKMISSLSEMPSLNSASNLISYFRSTEGLDKISQGVDGILLDNCSYIQDETGIFTVVPGGTWNVGIASVDNYNSGAPDSTVKTHFSKDMSGNSTDTVIRIYRSINEDLRFNNKDNTWKVVDVKDIPSVIALCDGQVLDMSTITESPSSLTIMVTGKATIIGNQNTTYNNTNIVINTNEQVTIKNFNCVCSKFGTPIEVKSKDSKIKFEGTNTFTGCGGFVYKNVYNEHDFGNNPVGASQGMLIKQGASVTITGEKASFYGKDGGAGICTAGDLVIDGAEIVAEGSSRQVSVGYLDSSYDYDVPKYSTAYSVGSGIGASVTYVNQEKSKGQTYTSYGTITIKNDAKVTAKGVMPDGTDNSYSMDIGGVNYANGFNYGQFTNPIKSRKTINISGSINNSFADLSNNNLDSKISINDSKFKSDIYTITTTTAGTDGDTTDGIQVNIHGTNGESGWMNFSDLGDDQGTQSATTTSSYVGKIQYIDVKVNSSNCWYPEKITVKAQFGGSEVTFYGGCWMSNGTDHYTLNPNDNVFELNIKTGSDFTSGTDCDVFAQLVDENGKETGWTNLSDIHPDFNAFETDDNSTFYIKASDDFGKIQYVELRSESNGTAASDWYIDDITVKQVQGKNKGDGFSFNADQWDVNDRVMSFGRESGKIGTFDIEIKTSDKLYAGTDANIDIELYGKNGTVSTSTGRVEICDYMENYTPGNNYERDDTDKCRITFDLGKNGLGNLTGIKLYNKGGGAGPDWHVDYVKITEINPDGSRGKTYHFNFNCEIVSGANCYRGV